MTDTTNMENITNTQITAMQEFRLAKGWKVIDVTPVSSGMLVVEFDRDIVGFAADGTVVRNQFIA